jgi:hypothetical protein
MAANAEIRNSENRVPVWASSTMAPRVVTLVISKERSSFVKAPRAGAAYCAGLPRVRTAQSATN